VLMSFLYIITNVLFTPYRTIFEEVFNFVFEAEKLRVDKTYN
jgi:hypothetical protein